MRAASIVRGGLTFGIALAVAIGAVGLGGCQSSGRGPGCGGCETTSCCAPEPCGPAPCAVASSPCAGPCAAPSPCEPCVGGWPPNVGAECGEVWCLVKKPAVIDCQTCTKVVCPEHCAPSCIPAVTTKVCDYGMVKPARVRYVKTPARYECFTETFVKCPAKTEWVCSSKEDACGCRKEFWHTRSTKAKLGCRTKRVMVQPESVQAVWECAEYRDCQRTVVLRPAHENAYPVEPVIKTWTTTRVICPETCEWQRNAACEVPAAR